MNCKCGCTSFGGRLLLHWLAEYLYTASVWEGTSSLNLQTKYASLFEWCALGTPSPQTWVTHKGGVSVTLLGCKGHYCRPSQLCAGSTTDGTRYLSTCPASCLEAVASHGHTLACLAVSAWGSLNGPCGDSAFVIQQLRLKGSSAGPFLVNTGVCHAEGSKKIFRPSATGRRGVDGQRGVWLWK